jgi:hypothetical protein
MEQAFNTDHGGPPYRVVILSSSFSNHVPKYLLKVQAEVPRFCKSMMILLLIFDNQQPFPLLRQIFSINVVGCGSRVDKFIGNVKEC